MAAIKLINIFPVLLNKIPVVYNNYFHTVGPLPVKSKKIFGVAEPPQLVHHVIGKVYL